jgi:hypothetical protein
VPELHWIDPWKRTAIRRAPTPETSDKERIDSWAVTAYEGDQPYIFVSYARDEKDLILFYIRGLAQLGFAVWWDEAIPGRAEWSAYIEQKIADAKSLMVLLSLRSAFSIHVTQEISFAEAPVSPFSAFDSMQPIFPKDSVRLSRSTRRYRAILPPFTRTRLKRYTFWGSTKPMWKVFGQRVEGRPRGPAYPSHSSFMNRGMHISVAL